MSLTAIVALLQSALLLLTAAQSATNLPQSFRDNAIAVAQQAISQATLSLSSQATTSLVTATATGINKYFTLPNGTVVDSLGDIISAAPSPNTTAPTQTHTENNPPSSSIAIVQTSISSGGTQDQKTSSTFNTNSPAAAATAPVVLPAPHMTASAGQPTLRADGSTIDDRFTITNPGDATTLNSITLTIDVPASAISNVQVNSNGNPWLLGDYTWFSPSEEASLQAARPNLDWPSAVTKTWKPSGVPNISIPAGGTFQVDVYLSTTTPVTGPAAHISGINGEQL